LQSINLEKPVVKITLRRLLQNVLRMLNLPLNQLPFLFYQQQQGDFTKLFLFSPFLQLIQLYYSQVNALVCLIVKYDVPVVRINPVKNLYYVNNIICLFNNPFFGPTVIIIDNKIG